MLYWDLSIVYNWSESDSLAFLVWLYLHVLQHAGV